MCGRASVRLSCARGSLSLFDKISRRGINGGEAYSLSKLLPGGQNVLIYRTRGATGLMEEQKCVQDVRRKLLDERVTWVELLVDSDGTKVSSSLCVRDYK